MRYVDVVAATIHPGVSAARIPKAARIEAAGLGVMEPVYAMMRQQMTFLDPPDHTRIRGLVHKAFSPAVVTALRRDIQSIADELLAPFEGAGRLDLIKDFAFPLPAIVIARMLGVRLEDRDQFKTWSTDIAELVGNPARSAFSVPSVHLLRGRVPLCSRSPSGTAGLRAPREGTGTPRAMMDTSVQLRLWRECLPCLVGDEGLRSKGRSPELNS